MKNPNGLIVTETCDNKHGSNGGLGVQIRSISIQINST